MLGPRWGWSSGFEATSPRWRVRWPCVGPGSFWRRRPPRSKGLRRGTSSTRRGRWPTASGGCRRIKRGRMRAGPCSGKAGSWRPTGTVVAEASTAVPGGTGTAELLVHRIDLHLAYQARGRRRDSSKTSAGLASTQSWSSRCRAGVGDPGSRGRATRSIDTTGEPEAVGRVPAVAGTGPDEVSLYEGLLTTRAIRRYTDETDTRRPLRDILFAATRAPSGSNRQPFRFVVLTDGPVAEEAKRLIGEGARRVLGRQAGGRRLRPGIGGRGGLAQGAHGPHHAALRRHLRVGTGAVVLACYVPLPQPHWPRPTVPRSTRPARTFCWRPAPSATAGS